MLPAVNALDLPGVLPCVVMSAVGHCIGAVKSFAAQRVMSCVYSRTYRCTITQAQADITVITLSCVLSCVRTGSVVCTYLAGHLINLATLTVTGSPMSANGDS